MKIVLVILICFNVLFAENSMSIEEFKSRLQIMIIQDSIITKAENGNAEAQVILACYFKISSDDERTFYWYNKAAINGNHTAQYQLALFYSSGTIVKKDNKVAVSWFRKSAKQDNVDAQLALAICYDEGDGVLSNPKKAFHWYSKAAENKNAEANLRMGCYYLGIKGLAELGVIVDESGVVKQSRSQANKFIAFAYENGNKDISRRADRIWKEYELWKYEK